MSMDELQLVKENQGKGVYNFYEEQNQIIDDFLTPVSPHSSEEDSQLLKLYAAIASKSLSDGDRWNNCLFSVDGHAFFGVDTWSIARVSIFLGTKFVSFLYRQTLRGFLAAKTFAQDHWNDLLVYGFGLTASLLGSKIYATAYENIQLIVGKSADTNFLKKVTYIVDTCSAYHAGNNLFVEVDIVMLPETPLYKSHNIGERLQVKLQKLPNAERAFDRVDYETSRAPEHQKAQ
ncbi:hypothetical protein K493DRAFT_405021 [Basidiobolus meristosporus CBS 931.73]|uniref:Uncharacterized protein n=1 Tax=Basidiobolus meristosporus CBS 931.73 TaxID=1314790 RepID=A0A1Y1YZ92_9FUNG|nr:hypothetical protein K493DRAFT_405021 [Basidiobolus meristosporus CBS 931.73]|eukprot:ORY03256.1 hypothetical protein K493DRAFT_405021 [Basidiobolus meristosporus CBS 931.73]